jgi:hypothetical protein
MLDTSKRVSPPTFIDGALVEQCGDAMTVCGQVWVTMRAVDEIDDRLWEWCANTGEILRTKP